MDFFLYVFTVWFIPWDFGVSFVFGNAVVTGAGEPGEIHGIPIAQETLIEGLAVRNIADKPDPFLSPADHFMYKAADVRLVIHIEAV